MKPKRTKQVIPKSINILGHNYKVKITDKVAIEMPDATGLCLYPQREIRLHKSLGKDIMWLNFLHEVRHAYQFESGLTQIMSHQSCETDAEQFASFISSLQKQGVL